MELDCWGSYGAEVVVPPMGEQRQGIGGDIGEALSGIVTKCLGAASSFVRNIRQKIDG